MRSAFVYVVLLALAHSLTGVHGAPTVVSDHANSLVARQDILSTILSIVQQIEEKVAQVLHGSIPSIAARAGSDSISSTFFTTTTSLALPAATNAPTASLSTPQASSTALARVRRQSPSNIPTSVLSGVVSVLGSLSTSLPPAPSVPSQPPTSKPVPTSSGVAPAHV